MALLFKKEEPHFKLGIWKIEEEADFFEQQITFRSKAVHVGRQLQQLTTRFLLVHLQDDFPIEEIETNQNGKPYLPGQELQFNISHSSELGAAILSESNLVGIDVERINARIVKVKHKYLASAELEAVNGSKDDEQLSYLTKYWAIKEAVYKWWGKGGVDFANDICILPTSLEAEQVEVRFGKKLEIDLVVSCFQLEEHWVAYVVN
jgi:phosphopantetheine--protein transferase-like protein